MASEITEQAFAKLNLGLKVLRRRDDGYHDILSVFQTIDLWDDLRFLDTGAKEIRILCSDPSVPTDARNLVHRAARVLCERTGRDRGVEIELFKHIPVGAGLGGGSADAAATLRALNRLWDLGLTPEELTELAEEIGSDVPFLVRGGTAVVSGRGEVLRPLSWRGDAFYLLFVPDISVGTGWAYEELSRMGLTTDTEYVNFINSTSDLLELERLFPVLVNDFEHVAERICPSIHRVRSELRRAGAWACSLSGSGSAFYGVFRTRETARSAARRLAMEEEGQIFLCAPYDPAARE